MKFGSMWVSPGRRSFDPDNRLVSGSFDIPWLWIEHVPTTHTVIWGGRPGRDIWVGSIEDQRRERFRRSAIQMTLVMRSFGPTMKRLNENLRALGKAYAGTYK